MKKKAKPKPASSIPLYSCGRSKPAHLCGPLGCSLNVYIVAKDPAQKQVLVGGLGSLGVGQMWFAERAHHRTLASYAKAPIVVSPP